MTAEAPAVKQVLAVVLSPDFEIVAYHAVLAPCQAQDKHYQFVQLFLLAKMGVTISRLFTYSS